MIEVQGQQMTAKQFLKQFAKLDLLIESMENQLEVLRSKSTKCTADMTAGASSGSSYYDRIGNIVVKIIAQQNILNTTRDTYADMKADIILAINLIPDYNQRLLLSYKYCESMTFPQIAVKMSYCERSVKYLHGDALISFEQAYKSMHPDAR